MDWASTERDHVASKIVDIVAKHKGPYLDEVRLRVFLQITIDCLHSDNPLITCIKMYVDTDSDCVLLFTSFSVKFWTF